MPTLVMARGQVRAPVAMKTRLSSLGVSRPDMIVRLGRGVDFMFEKRQDLTPFFCSFVGAIQR